MIEYNCLDKVREKEQLLFEVKKFIDTDITSALDTFRII